MSEPSPAADIPAIPLSRLYPPEGFLAIAGHAFVVGWRPAAGWACVAILVVSGAILPLCRGRELDWPELIIFVTLLLGHGAMQTTEKIMGVSQ